LAFFLILYFLTTVENPISHLLGTILLKGNFLIISINYTTILLQNNKKGKI